ncbi:hypothetical protein J5N97_000507 [Dioscorea zingiberensis]|uniref:Aminotransferase-like plant mobile domain-containing protein n=1 Tax=Dioscorea zingiberensis TaxID=325984 RepID=A0A9D5BS39_9LILI|nr:hypothetical protein J5N97_000507 [Dioscorea zingiberensis]
MDHRGFEWDLTSESVKGRVKEAGFDIVSSIRYVRLDHALLTSFIERWRGETNTFHMPVGEMTITLQDVEVLTGLRVDGRAVVANMYEDWENLCEELLGEVPEEIVKGMVPISWLYSTFSVVSEQHKNEDHVARAYILYLIGTRLMPYSSGNLVHLKWLMFVADFEACGEFAWGAAVLANLYHEMRRASGRHCSTTSACYTLLQV